MVDDIFLCTCQSSLFTVNVHNYYIRVTTGGSVAILYLGKPYSELVTQVGKISLAVHIHSTFVMGATYISKKYNFHRVDISSNSIDMRVMVTVGVTVKRSLHYMK